MSIIKEHFVKGDSDLGDIKIRQEENEYIR